MRFRERKNVDFPHPDGPIRATTERSGTSRETLNNACDCPYQKENSRIWNFEYFPFKSGGVRPTWERSEMIVAKESVVKRTPQKSCVKPILGMIPWHDSLA